MFSQNDEETVILQLLARARTVGRFLDIGAYDGVKFSNTRALALAGWGGVLVEPSPTAYAALERNYQGRHDVTLVQVAVVSGRSGPVRFFDTEGDLVSTVSDSHRSMWAGRRGHTVENIPTAEHVNFKAIDVMGLAVPDFLAKYPGPYDFINLDVEGTNLEIFQSLPLRKLECKVVCVEYENHAAEIVELATKQGYEACHRTTENLILRAV